MATAVRAGNGSRDPAECSKAQPSGTRAETRASAKR